MIERFWTEVALERSGEAWAVLLDGRRVNTPARAPLLLPTERLAEAVAAEWRAVTGKVDPAAMPLTGLANAAIDHVTPDPARFVGEVAAYADGDLLCYRAEAPAGLVEREATAWDPLLDWAALRYDISFEIVTGVIHRAQPPATIARLHQAVAALDPFALAAFNRMVPLTGTLVGTLAFAEQAVTAEALWDAAMTDEIWQAELWGEDAEATSDRAARRADLMRVAHFHDLSRLA